MKSTFKKLLLALVLVIALTGLILFQQIRQAFSITTTAETLPLLSPNLINVPTTEKDQMLGNPGAPMTVIGFFDLTDKQSKNYYQAIERVVAKNPLKIRFIWKDHPGSGIFTQPVTAHTAAVCAGAQNHFWDFVNASFAHKGRLSAKALREIATTLYLNLPQWDFCVSDSATTQLLGEDIILAEQLGLPSAPVVFINNKMLNPNEEVDLEQLLTSFIAQ
jgi:protein-disulfide isomerase